MLTKAAEADNPVVQHLRSLVRESPDMNDITKIYEVILPILGDADLHVTPVSITPEQAHAKMEMGLPLLQDIDLECDIQEVRTLLFRLASSIETSVPEKRQQRSIIPWLRELRRLTSGLRKSNGEAPPNRRKNNGSNALLCPSAAGRIRQALEEDRLDISELLPHIAANKSGPVASAAASLNLDPGLTWTVAQNAFKPALRAWRRQLAPLAENIAWQKGFCFVCGAVASLAELQGNNQVKHLRCGQCGADWIFRRLQCMYCGNEDHRTQRLLFAEGSREKMHAEACDKCHGYLKVISSFAPVSPEMLAVHDLATLHLDYIAQEQGYDRVMISS